MIRLSQNIFSQLPTKTQLFIGAEFKAVVVGLDHHGLIYRLIFSCHRGTTFYTLLWKSQHFMGDGFKPTAKIKFSQFCEKLDTCEGLSLKPMLSVTPIWANRWKPKRYWHPTLYEYLCFPKWVSKPFKAFALKRMEVFLYYFLIWRAITNRYPPINSILHNVGIELSWCKFQSFNIKGSGIFRPHVGN